VQYNTYKSKSSCKSKTISARTLWAKIMKIRSETGSIYLFHTENVNESTLLNRYIGSSNLCLAGDTEIQTSDATKLLKDITSNDSVYSMNTETYELELKKVTNSGMTNPNTKVMKITDTNGQFIICTPEHKIWTENRGYIMAKDLLETDKLNIKKDYV